MKEIVQRLLITLKVPPDFYSEDEDFPDHMLW